MSDRAVAARMRRQHGVVSRQQVIAAGLTDRQIHHRLASGVWVRTYRGVYRHAATDRNWHNDVFGACLAVDGLASHRAAAFLHRIEGFDAQEREVVVAHGRWRGLVGVHVHQTTQLDRVDATTIDGIPCTGLARTVLDLGAVVSRRRLESVVDSVVRDVRLDWADLRSVLDRHARRGRDGCAPLRAILEERDGEDRVPLSDWSRMVAALLVDQGLPSPVLEHRVHEGAGRFLAQVDLAYPTERVAVELDSVRWHLNRESFESDRRRWNRLVTGGWTVLSFTWADYVDRPGSLVSAVSVALGRS